MKEKANYQPLLITVLIIIAGTISPSNGVDDKVNKTPLELIATMLVIILAGISAYVIWKGLEKQKESL